MDYVAPLKLPSESDADYEMRKNAPLFLANHTETSRVVEFYSPWCGHCVHFKPVYIRMARDVNEVSPLAFHAVSCQAHPKICKDQKIQGYPSLKWFEAGSSEGYILDRTINAETILKDLLRVDEAEIKAKLVVVEDGKAKDKKGSNEVAAFSKHGVFQDATLSFNFALRSSIFMTNDALTDKQAAVLKKWLDLLHKTVPTTMKAVKYDVRGLIGNFDKVKESEENLIEQLEKNIGGEWTKNCSKRKAGAGYTCGLWELFHVVTVGLVQWNIMSYNRVATTDAADMLRDYVETFFQCDECRTNFSKMYDACQFQRCERLNSDISDEAMGDWKQLPLWLWETHNDVNVRLFNEERKSRGLRPATFVEEQKARWPPKKLCKRCWLAGGGWNEEEVYKFLQSHYWPSDSNDPGIREHLTAARDGIANIAGNNPFVVTAAALLVLALYFVSNRRRKRRIRRLDKKN